LVQRGSDWQVSAWIDGANTSRAATIEGYVQSAHDLFSDQRDRESSDAASSDPTTSIEVRYRYNPTAESIYSIGPAVPAMLLMMFLAILMAVSVAREKEIGTITNFYATPTTRLEFLIGKQLPYIGIGMINFSRDCCSFKVPPKGDGFRRPQALLYVAAATGCGLVDLHAELSRRCSPDGAVDTLTMQFSGMMQPVSTLRAAPPHGASWPMSYRMHMSRGVHQGGFSDMATDRWRYPFCPAFLALSALLRKQEK
jgi:ribosome-dependent ATPase